ATDSNVGYPTTLSPDNYRFAKFLCSNVDYPLLDPLVAGGILSFWFSPLDLWTEWCALQTPFASNVRGQTKYACVPQTANSSTTDFGKLILCTNALDGPQCLDSTGHQVPCACLPDAAVGPAGQDLCGQSVCECSATQCRAVL